MPSGCAVLAVVVWLVAGGGNAAAIGQPERAARAGMTAYRAGDFETSAGAFAAAAELRHGNARLWYNAGAAAYRLGSYGVARRLLQASINGGAEHRLAAAAHLAVGHSWMAEAEPLAGTDPAAAMTALESAIQSYERALRLDRADGEAAYHLERARILLDELRQQVAQEGSEPQDNGGQQQQQQSPPPPEQQNGESAQGAENQQSQQEEEEEQQQQQSAPQDEDQQDADMRQETAEGPRSNEDAGALARQIIAAEEALAAMMERRRREMEPVAQDW